ncbi:MAG: lytic transglycosylase domain-containing protein [Alphaproteobacteria bacterium]|nr:lytic transglycosylase domain-containing protein [Alphaproteobacteria bacterium]
MAINPAIPAPGTSATNARETARKTIQEASAKGEPSFRYMLASATLESGMRPGAEAPNSSAAGLYQFTQSTWLSMVRDHGPKHGLGDLAKAVKTAADGSVTVEDADLRGKILALRRDATLSAAMTAEYAKQNSAYLEARLGRPANDVDLYAAHFFGPAGAVRLLRAVAADGGSPAADLLKGAARSNPAMFYEANGKTKSAQTVFASLAQRLHEAGSAVRVAGATGEPHAGNARLIAQLPAAGAGPG